MTYHHFKHEACSVMDGTSMYNCPTFFLFWKCLDDMSYWTNLYRTVADNQLHFFTISNLNYTVFESLVHIYAGRLIICLVLACTHGYASQSRFLALAATSLALFTKRTGDHLEASTCSPDSPSLRPISKNLG